MPESRTNPPRTTRSQTPHKVLHIRILPNKHRRTRTVHGNFHQISLLATHCVNCVNLPTFCNLPKTLQLCISRLGSTNIYLHMCLTSIRPQFTSFPPVSRRFHLEDQVPSRCAGYGDAASRGDVTGSVCGVSGDAAARGRAVRPVSHAVGDELRVDESHSERLAVATETEGALPLHPADFVPGSVTEGEVKEWLL